METTARSLRSRLALGPRWRAMLMVAAALLSMSLGTGRADAQGVSARVGVSRETVELGDTVIYQIAVEGATGVPVPELPKSDAYAAQFLGAQDQSMRSTMIINGRRTEENRLGYVMQWQIAPMREGSITIPGFTLDVGTQKLAVDPISIRARKPSDNPDFKLTLECDKTTAYVGEPVRMRLVWTLQKRAQPPAFTGPDGGTIFDIAVLDPRPVGDRSTPVRQDDSLRVVRFLDREAIIRRTQVTVDGASAGAWIVDLIITPRQAGRLEVGPYSVVFDAVIGENPRSMFDPPWADRNALQRTVIRSNPHVLEVKPLPDAGRPSDFTGLIGEFTVAARAGNSEASVGDPVPLTISIRGPEPMAGVTPPSLDSHTGFAGAFKSSPDGWERSVGAEEPGLRTFTTTVRPLNDKLSAIPPIRLPYFNTSTGRYAVAETAPIPIKVRPAREVTAADALLPSRGPNAAAIMSAPNASLSEMPLGLAPNVIGLQALDSDSAGALNAAPEPWLIGVLIVPPLSLAITALAVRRRRTIDHDRLARRAAVDRAKASLGTASSPEQVAAALRIALAPRVGVAESALTSADAGSAAGSARAAAAELATLENAMFSGLPIDLTGAKARAAEAIRRLGKDA